VIQDDDLEEFHNSRRMLVGLLAQPDDAPVTGIEQLRISDRLFLVCTCSMQMIEITSCAMASYDPDGAIEGLEALIVDARRRIIELCAKHNGAHQ
jgi:hypothetical protein